MNSITCLALLWLPFAASDEHVEPLCAAWTYISASRAIEWFEVFGDPPDAILVAYASGEIDVLDPASGIKRNSTSIRGSPGARLAETWGRPATPGPRIPVSGAASSQPRASRRAYVFDRFTVASIDTDRGAEVWRAGDPPPRTVLGGDPEFVNGIAAAAETATGVAVLRRDGELGLLDAETGRATWLMQAATGGECRLHVRASTICVVSQVPLGTTVTTIDTRGSPPAVRHSVIAGFRADWSAAWRGGVVLASTQALAAVAGDGGITRIEPTGSDFLLSSLRVIDARGQGDAVIAQRRDGTIEGVDAASLRSLWRVAPPRAASTRPASRIDGRALLSANGDYLVIAEAGEAVILRASTGEVVRREPRGAPSRIHAAGMRDDDLMLLFDRDSGATADLRLSVSRMSRATTSPVELKSGRVSEYRVFRLVDITETPAAAKLNAGGLFVHQPHRLTAYSIPTLSP